MSDSYFQNETKNNQYLLGYRDGMANAGQEWLDAMDNAHLWNLRLFERSLPTNIERTPAVAQRIVEVLREAAAISANTISPRMHYITVKHLAFYQCMFAAYLVGNVLDAISRREWLFLAVAIIAVAAQTFIGYATWKGYRRAKAEITAALRANDIDNEP